MAARHVVDQVAQRLGHRVQGVRGQEDVQVVGGPPGVEGAADRGRREAVDGRGARRLDVRGQRQLARHRRGERPGGDRGQVALDQDVLDRVGQRRAQGGGHGVARQAEQQGPALRGQHPGRAAHGGDQAQPRGLAQRPQDELVGDRPAAPGTLPEQPVDQRLQRRRAAGGQVGEHAEGVAAEFGDGPARDLGGQRRHRAVAVVGHADPAGAAVGDQPGRREVGPAALGRQAQPAVVGRGGQPEAGAQVARDQARGVGGLDVERGLVLRHVQRHGGAPQVPDADAAAAQDAGRRGGPGVEDLLDAAGRGARGSGRRLVGRPRVLLPRGHRRGLGREVAVQAGAEDVAAEEERDLAGQDDGVLGPAAEESSGEEPFEG